MTPEIANKLIHLQVGNCTCGTKSNVIKYHDPNCTYRLAVELEALLETLNDEVEAHVEKLREVAQRWLDWTSKPAGLTPDIVRDDNAFTKWNDKLDAELAALVADTKAAMERS